jgi:hypothetical protein
MLYIMIGQVGGKPPFQFINQESMYLFVLHG